MKNILLAIFCVVLFSACTKKTNPVTPSTPNNPSNPNPVFPTTSRFIPNWQRDTLRGQCLDINNQPVFDPVKQQLVYDTVITYSINDTSFVEYQGFRYYLWWEPLASTDTFENNSSAYYSCVLSTKSDTTGIVAEMVGARPFKYWDDFYKDWAYRQQQLFSHNFNKKYKLLTNGYNSIKQ